MEQDIIVRFAKLYLEKYKYLTIVNLQKFIMNREEVGRAISPESIEESINSLCFDNFIRVVGKKDNFIVYERNIN